MTEAGDADPKDFFLVTIFWSPNAGEKFFRANNLAHAMDKLEENSIFGCRKRDRLAFSISPDFCASKIDANISVREISGLCAAGGNICPAKDCAYAGE